MTTAIIPARYGSTRLPGKPLAMIAGKTLVQRAWEQAKKYQGIDRVIVATEDQRVADVVASFGGEYLITDEDCRTGTDRLAQVANLLELDDDEIVINIQGDQPVFDPECLAQLIAPFSEDSELLSSTLAFKIVDPREVTDPKDVKVVFDKNGFALYFSRACIPFPRSNEQADYYKHLGFYAFKKHFLDTFASLPTGDYEHVEKLEQLRILQYGYQMKVVVTEHDSPEIDLPEDIQRVENQLSIKG